MGKQQRGAHSSLQHVQFLLAPGMAASGLGARTVLRKREHTSLVREVADLRANSTSMDGAH